MSNFIYTMVVMSVMAVLLIILVICLALVAWELLKALRVRIRLWYINYRKGCVPRGYYLTRHDEHPFQAKESTLCQPEPNPTEGSSPKPPPLSDAVEKSAS